MPAETRSRTTGAATRKQAHRRAAAEAKPSTSASPPTAAAKSTKPARATKPKPKIEEPDTAETPPSDLPTVLCPTLADWEAYLSSQPSSGTAGVWLQIAKKTAPTPSVTYHDAVDGALCHGWIDGQRRALSATHFVQRFTPRRRGSLWSARNVARVEALEREGRLRPAGRAEIDAGRADGRLGRAYAGSRDMAVPADLAAALAGDAAARAFLDGLNRSQRYSFLWRVETAKTDAARRKRIATCVEMLREGKTF